VERVDRLIGKGGGWGLKETGGEETAEVALRRSTIVTRITRIDDFKDVTKGAPYNHMSNRSSSCNVGTLKHFMPAALKNYLLTTHEETEI